ncbi:hypothetical protein FCV25MIE_00902 [Fagus crenata]
MLKPWVDAVSFRVVFIAFIIYGLRYLTELIDKIQAPGWRSLHEVGPAHADLAAQAGPSDLVAQDRSRSSSKEALCFDFEMINKQIGLIFVWFQIK